MSAQDSAANKCACKGTKSKAGWSAVGGVLASLGVCAACCLLPMALIVLGIGGTVAARLESLAAYKWIFVALTAAFLAYGFYVSYFRKPTCPAGPDCQSCKTGRGIRVALWTATFLAVAGLAFEQLEPLL